MAKTTQKNTTGGRKGLADVDAYLQSADLMIRSRESGCGRGGVEFGTGEVPKYVRIPEALIGSGVRRGVEKYGRGGSEPVRQHGEGRTREASI